MATGPLFWALKARVRTVTKPRAGRNPNPEPRPNALDKLVLITLADQASEVEGWSALLPLWFIADRAECTERAARESVRRLEDAGLVRSRPVVLEGNNAEAWRRYYLLAPESPVAQGVLVVDWDESERIRRSVFERHRAIVLSRHEGERPARKRTYPQPPEPGSGDEPDPRNQVPPQGRNQVPPPPEPGSALGEEPGSALISLSSRDLLLPSFDAHASASEDRRNEGHDQAVAEPSAAALEMVRSLDFGKHRWPTQDEVCELAVLVDRAINTGLTPSEVRQHAQASIASAQRHAVKYLRGALTTHLPAPRLRSQPDNTGAFVECADCRRPMRTRWGSNEQPRLCRDCRETASESVIDA